ncbi:MAG: PilZ domain-containing protein [Deltaproteobacteria bacterium]|nr:PilZ domain-containing protein [Deltaproteobacteria bacterium]
MVFIEKRKQPRGKSVQLSYVCMDENHRIIHQSMGRTLNVSQKGVLLETHFQIDLNHTLLISVGLGDNLVELEGKVIYCRKLKNGKFATGIQINRFLEGEPATWREHVESAITTDDDMDASPK